MMHAQENISVFSKRILFVFFLFISSLCILFSSGTLESEDGWLYASVARNIYYTREVTSAPDEYPTRNVHMNTSLGSDGKWRALGSLGYSLSLVPAVFLSDLVHRYYQAPPPSHFPLESDWSFHLFASFTNAVIGGICGVFLVLLGKSVGLSRGWSLTYALLTLLSTTVLIYTKSSFAQLLFTTALVATVFFLKQFFTTQAYKYILLSLISFGVVVFSYNVSYYLTIIPLLVYSFLQSSRVQKLLILLAIPSGLLFLWIFFQAKLIALMTMWIVFPKVLFEGTWGFLFSSGKSIFLYSPPLMLLLFWHKIPKKLLPEIVFSLTLLGFYLYFLGSPWIGSFENKMPIWHGGMDWGPRYILPTIPFLMLLVTQIIKEVPKKVRILCAVPLVVAGFFVQLVGASVPYIMQYRDLPFNFFLGKNELTVYDYASFIPRYSPLFTSTKELYRKITDMPRIFSHGTYNVRLIDGFDMPYKSGNTYFRGFREQGVILFSDEGHERIQTISISFYHAPDDERSSASAQIQILLNGSVLQEIVIKPKEEASIQITVPENTQRPNYEMHLVTTYLGKKESPHVIYIKELKINNTPSNLGSLDYPDVSTLGAFTSTRPYIYYGNVLQDHWTLWHMRARVNEQIMDYWWLETLIYWDRPQTFLWILFVVNLMIVGGSAGYLLSDILRSKSR